MTLSRRAFLRLAFFASVAALRGLAARRLPAFRARAAGSGVLVHTAGEFLT